LIKDIGDITQLKPGFSDDLFTHLKFAYDMIGKKHKLDLTAPKTKASLRVRYLTSMAHFFKLRCALYKSAGV
jgi:hypothetical protein